LRFAEDFGILENVGILAGLNGDRERK